MSDTTTDQSSHRSGLNRRPLGENMRPTEAKRLRDTSLAPDFTPAQAPEAAKSAPQSVPESSLGGADHSTELDNRLWAVRGALSRAEYEIRHASGFAGLGNYRAAAERLAEGWAHVERVRAEADALAHALALPHVAGEVARG